MKRKLRSTIAALALLSLILSSGCGRGTSPAQPGQGEAIKRASVNSASAQEGDGAVVVRKSPLSLPDMGVAIRYTAMAGGYIYMCGQAENGWYSFYRMDRELKISRLDLSYEEPIENFSADDSGGIYILNTDETGKKRIVCFSGNGDKTELRPEAIANEAVIVHFSAVGGGFIVDTMSQVLALDGEGKLVKSFGEYQGGTWLVRLGDGKAFVIYTGSLGANAPAAFEKAMRMELIDGELEVSGSIELHEAYTSFFGGIDGELFTVLGGGVYEYDYRAGALTQKFDAGSSPNLPEYYLGGDRYFIVERGVPVILTAERDSGVKRLVLGGYNIDARLETAAQMFNSANRGYTIVLDDYARYDEYDNQDAGAIRFAADIISGNVPDIFDLSNVSAERCSAQGLLEDLRPYFDGDRDMDADMPYPKLLELTEFKGGVYQLSPGFMVAVICGASDLVPSPFTTEKLAELANLYSPQKLLGAAMSSGRFMRHILMSMHDELYSPEDKTCSFDTEEFAEVLEIAAALPEEVPPGISQDECVLDGEQMLIVEWLGPYFVDHIALSNTMFGGQARISGLPSGRGHGASILPQLPLGMSASSEGKEGVWEFFKFLLSESMQLDYFGRWFFPANNTALEKYIEGYISSYIESPLARAMLGGETIQGSLEADAARDAAYAVFDSIDAVAVCNSEIYNIIMDCCGALFNGDKTAGETAALIQSKVAIYLAEQYG